MKRMGRRAALRHPVIDKNGKAHLAVPIGPAVEPGTVSTNYAHGICRSCGRRTWLYQPARICERDLLKEAAKFEAQAASQMLAAMEEEFGEEDDGDQATA